MGVALSPPALRVRGVTVAYSADVRVGPIDLDAPGGSCLGLIGANGAGKTTLLRVITGLLRCDSGEVFVFGQPVRYGSVPKRLSGMIEEPRFFMWLDARRNLEPLCASFPGRLNRIPEVLRRVGLDPDSRRQVAAFSQGMRQRLAIARVLVTNADVVVFDEPTNGLDPVGIRWFRGLIGDLVAEGRTVILSSHMLHEVQEMAATYAMLAEGRVIACGSVSDVKQLSSLEELYFSAVES